VRTPSLSFYRSDIAVGYPPGIDVVLEGMRLCKNRTGEGLEAEAMESGSSLTFVFPLLARHFMERKGDIHGREWTCVAIARRMGGKLR